MPQCLLRVRRPVSIPLWAADQPTAFPAGLATWDAYLTDLHPMRWLTSELARIVKHRIDNSRAAILDGVCALDVVDQIKRKADFLIFLRGGDEGSSLAPQILAYRSRRRPDQLAQFTLEGYVE